MRENLTDKLREPLNERRQVDVANQYFFTRDPVTKRLWVSPRTKRYGLVFDKRVADTETFRSYPYGYQWNPPTELDDEYMVNVQALLEL